MRDARMRRRAILTTAVAAAALALAATAAWAWSTPDSLLRERLARWQFWTLELQFAILAAASAHQLRHLARSLDAPVRAWRLLAATCAVCLVLAAAVAPRT